MALENQILRETFESPPASNMQKTRGSTNQMSIDGGAHLRKKGYANT